jgi:hypothetical protein
LIKIKKGKKINNPLTFSSFCLGKNPRQVLKTLQKCPSRETISSMITLYVFPWVMQELSQTLNTLLARAKRHGTEEDLKRLGT